MLKQLESFDWEQVFCGRVETYPGSAVKAEPVPTREDVDTICKIEDDSPEGYGSWEGKMAGRLKDGRWIVAEGWCDTTGWGCQDGASVTLCESETELRKLLGDWADWTEYAVKS